MTAEQNKIVYDNLDLVDFICFQMREYTKGNRTLIEDCNSVATASLCECACRYCAEKGDFRAYAIKNMRWSVWDFLRKEFSKGFSYSNNVSSKELAKVVWVDGVNEKIDCNDNIGFIENMTVLMSILTQDEKEILNLCLDGKNRKEISEALDLSMSVIHTKTLSLKNKMKSVFDSEDGEIKQIAKMF